MAAEIINLRKARKARDRGAAEARAAENRAKFGRTKAEREVGKAEDMRQARHLDGHQLAGPTGSDTDEPA